MNMHFDTLAAVKRIEAAGLERAKAEAVVGEIVAAQVELADKADLAAAATGLKADIAAVESGLKADIAAVESGLKADIAAVESGLKADIARIDARFEKVDAQFETTKAELRADIAAVKTDIIRWMFGSQVFLIVALVALAQFTKML